MAWQKMCRGRGLVEACQNILRGVAENLYQRTWHGKGHAVVESVEWQKA